MFLAVHSHPANSMLCNGCCLDQVGSAVQDNDLPAELSPRVQGEQPHCGFPEAMYHQNAERLVRAGLRVVVIEQTETPDQLKARNGGRQKAEKKVRFII